MIRIVRGPRSRLHGHFAARSESRPEDLSLAPKYSFRAWNGIRHLLDGLRRLDGDERVDTVLATDPAVGSLLLGRPADELPSDVVEDRARVAAHPESHLSHNLVIQRPFFERVAKLLSGWTERSDGTRSTWLVPDLALMDRETLGALRTLLRRHPDEAPDLVVGFDPNQPFPVPDDNTGLTWEQDPELVHKLVFGLLALPDTEAVDLEPSGPELEPNPPRASSDEDLAIAFGSFAFTAVVTTGLEVLAGETRLSDAERAEVHGLVGLAAHNRQFRSAGNRTLARFLQQHFERALALETRPARRSCLAYRLAVTHARRLGELDDGRRYADQAVEEARHPDVEPLRSAHLEAWGRNIRAYVEMRAGNDDAAMEDCKAGYEIVDGQLEGHENAAHDPDPWVREAAYTRSLLADNLAALFQKVGDGEALRRWKAKADRLAHEVPSLRRFEAVTWTRLYRESHRPDLALHHAREGLEAARTEQDGLRELEYRVHVADLLDRLGRTDEALAAFQDARSLRRRLGDPPHFVDLDVPTAGVALRSGRAEVARELLETVWERSSDDLAVRADVAALLGLTAARREPPDPDSVETWINRAIETAVASGARDVLLRVATTAGDAARRLGRPGDAYEAYERALEIAGTGSPSDPAGDPPAPPPAADLLAALVGRLETAPTAEPDSQLLQRAVDLLPDALQEAQGWSLLPRLAELFQRNSNRPDTPSSDGSEVLRRALELRDADRVSGTERV